MKTTRTLQTAAALFFIASAAHAQIPQAGTAAFSMAGNYLAAARGYEAMAQNPANLGFSSNPGFSINLFTVGGATGLSPVKFNDIGDFGGKLIPASTKEQWLQAIGSGTERGGVEGGLSIIALTFGHVGFQAGLTGTGTMNMNQDAAEALLFGNAGRTGTPKSLNFNGSNANGGGFGVGAVSFGIPISKSPESELSLGITGKYVIGLGGGRAMDNGSTVTSDNVNVQFPTIYTDSSHIGSAGSGVGIDLGLAWTNGQSSFSVVGRNLMNTFAWDKSSFVSRVGTFSFDGTTSKSSFTEQPYGTAPAALRKALEDEKFQPEIAAGFAHRNGNLLFTVDGGQRIGDGIELGPKMHVGGGAQLDLSMLALRGGAAIVTDGFQVAGGVGLKLGGYELGAGVSSRSRNGGNDLGVLVSLVSIR